MMTPDQVAEKAYPAILRGKRVIVPGVIDKLAILVGKFLPFPLAIRVTGLIYHFNVKKVDPTYPSEPAEVREDSHQVNESTRGSDGFGSGQGEPED
jgi:hypothetical protein